MPTKNNQTDIFHSKIMLFGEYSIILGSMGLTIPYAHFNGSLGFINKNRYTDLDFARRSNALLTEYFNYITRLADEDKLPDGFDLRQMKTDLSNGLYFESSIPEGYGLGSSGALVASLYHRYMNSNNMPRRTKGNEEVLQLKQDLAVLESWFHGTSSGIDPLICYMKHPLLLTESKSVRAVEIPRYNLSADDAIFLINSGQPGKTAPLVDQFMKECQNPEFMNLMTEEYIPINNNCILHLINGNLDSFSIALRELSLFQATHFNHLIPGSLDKEWIYGISNGEYILKLCGSGGGGFVLGFTREFSEVKKRFSNLNMEIIPVYQTDKT